MKSIDDLHMTSKIDCTNYDQSGPNFDMTYNTVQCVFVPNLGSLDQRKQLRKQSSRPKKLENFRLRYINVLRFSKL